MQNTTFQLRKAQILALVETAYYVDIFRLISRIGKHRSAHSIHRVFAHEDLAPLSTHSKFNIPAALI